MLFGLPGAIDGTRGVTAGTINAPLGNTVIPFIVTAPATPEAPLCIPTDPIRPEPIAPTCAPTAPPIIPPSANAGCAQSAIAAVPNRAVIEILFLNIVVFNFLTHPLRGCGQIYLPLRIPWLIPEFPAKSIGKRYRPFRREEGVKSRRTKLTQVHQLRPLNRSSVLPIAQRMSQKKILKFKRLATMQSVEPEISEKFSPFAF
jgi:hypothetical protein